MERTSRNLDAPARPHTAIQSLSGNSGSPIPSMTGTHLFSAAPFASPFLQQLCSHLVLRQHSAVSLEYPA